MRGGLHSKHFQVPILPFDVRDLKYEIFDVSLRRTWKNTLFKNKPSPDGFSTVVLKVGWIGWDGAPCGARYGME